MTVIVLLETVDGPRAFHTPGPLGAEILLRGLARALGAEAPRSPGRMSSGPAGRIGYWRTEVVRPTSALLIFGSDELELRLFEDPIAALRAAVLCEQEHRILRLEAPAAIESVARPALPAAFLSAFSVPPPALGASSRARVPPAFERAFSDTPAGGAFCPRCADHPLHDDPVLDDTGRLDGARICNPCGTIEALRFEHGPEGPFAP